MIQDSIIHLLIIEDHQPDTRLLINAINQSGFQTRISVQDNIEDGLISALQYNYDCIFLDFYFPGKSGMDFLTDYAKGQGTANVIMFSSQDDLNMAVECMKAGAVDYIAKNNITPAVISKSLRYVFNLKKAKESTRKAENALMESELKLKRIIASSPITLFNIDNNGVFTLFKGKATEHLSYKAESVVGKSIYETGTQLPIQKEQYEAALRDNNLQFEVQIKDRFFEVNYIPVRGENNRVLNMMGVVTDITAFKKNEESLKNNLAEAEMMAKVKEEFFAAMSHEIRTPIHGIISLTQFVLSSELNAEQQKYLELIRKSADNLLVIINDILDISKMDSDKMTFEQVPLNIKDITQTAVASFLPKANEKNIEIITVYNETLPDVIYGDPVRLTQILNNLLSNAVKFTEKGNVSIKINEGESNQEYTIINFEVSDTGIGIAPGKLSRVFESFDQLSDDINRKYGGTGLGLSIVKKLVEKQQGVIRVHSQPGCGTTFQFSIPFKLNTTDNQIDKKTDPAEIPEIRSNINVLVAEDNDINRFIIEKMLSDWEVKCDFATTGIEVMEKLQQSNYDLILMDIEMPDMNGYKATEAIRNETTSPTNNIPIIAMTGHAMSGEREKCISCGMNDYLSKPFKPDVLKKMLVTYTSKDLEVENNYSEPVNAEVKAINIAERLTDLTFLKEISDNNDSFFSDFIKVFLNTTPQSLNDLSNAIIAQDWEKIRQVSHKMKPAFNYVGLKECNKMAAKIEDLSKSKSESTLLEIKTMAEKIKQISARAMQELEMELTSINP